MVEEWRELKGYDKKYMISNLGNFIDFDFQNKGITKKYIFKPKKDKYQFIGVYKNGKRQTTGVHRLVAEAFIPNPSNLPMINHKDEDKSNNCVDNLEWCDCKYNVNYSLYRNAKVYPTNYFRELGNQVRKEMAYKTMISKIAYLRGYMKYKKKNISKYIKRNFNATEKALLIDYLNGKIKTFELGE